MLSPNFRQLAYDTAQFGPFDVQQLLMFCVLVHLRLLLTWFLFSNKGEDRAAPSESL